MNRQRSSGRVRSAAVAAVCAVAVLPGQARAADGPGAYAFDPAAKTVRGTETNADAAELTPGSVYKSSIKPGEKLYYRVDLDDRTDAYVSAVAVPKAAGQVAYGDGITVSIRDLDDSRCGSGDGLFKSAEFPRPVAAYAYRTVEKDDTGPCAAAGAYNVLIERQSKATSSPVEWDLELRYVTEPALKSGDALPTEAPETWSSSSPTPPTGRQKRSGGSGFYEATSLETGEWTDTVAPGQTRFYRVPVDWGQQIFATAGLSNNNKSTEYHGNALSVALDNPALGHVGGATTSYSGKPASVALDPLPPVAYQNRYDAASAVSAMRFAGWYYLSVTLDPAVAEHYGDTPIGLTLRITVRGKALPGPYAGDAGIFGVSGADRDMARTGQSAPEAEKSDRMTMVAAGGIGAGSVLVIGLGVWTLLARRRAVTAPTPPAAGGQPPYDGRPPQAW
ncbi:MULTISPECIES: hypothetical protein [unclassified Streptomyces]|uniref:hypothetical protein n=1 Tax=unclassified Streptomyces TaxID=2593676 RepID=UPI0004908F9E|nr:hypothetical protein [Streptomyces sp. DpondAA-D4]MYY17560.1 hypothetical protein [Streptomyces sp. SID4912]SCE32590.1 hypothetical protein GA0115241_113374 [Streptomyces sp. DpondAA-D4]